MLKGDLVAFAADSGVMVPTECLTIDINKTWVQLGRAAKFSLDDKELWNLPVGSLTVLPDPHKRYVLRQVVDKYIGLIVEGEWGGVAREHKVRVVLQVVFCGAPMWYFVHME
jgi:hypothetical protein